MTSPFDNVEFSSNPDPRSPVVVVADCSDSMTQVRPGETRSPLEALNGALDILVNELHQDPLARRRSEIAFVAYGSQVAEPTPFATVESLALPILEPMGLTSTGEAMNTAMDIMEERKKEYDENGIQRYRGTILLITDGLSTDDVTEASSRIREGESSKKFMFFPVAVEGADLEALEDLGGKVPAKLSGVKFEELFAWLSASQSAISSSQPGDSVKLPPPGWAEF